MFFDGEASGVAGANGICAQIGAQRTEAGHRGGGDAAATHDSVCDKLWRQTYGSGGAAAIGAPGVEQCGCAQGPIGKNDRGGRGEAAGVQHQVFKVDATAGQLAPVLRRIRLLGAKRGVRSKARVGSCQRDEQSVVRGGERREGDDGTFDGAGVRHDEEAAAGHAAVSHHAQGRYRPQSK